MLERLIFSLENIEEEEKQFKYVITIIANCIEGSRSNEKNIKNVGNWHLKKIIFFQ